MLGMCGTQKLVMPMMVGKSKSWKVGKNSIAIVIPKNVASELGITIGDEIGYYYENGQIVIKKKSSEVG